MADRLTKVLLAVVALGLWVQIIGTWLKPAVVQAQGMSEVHLSDIASVLRNIRSSIQSIENDISSIESDVSYIEDDVDDIEDGTCINGMIC